MSRKILSVLALFTLALALIALGCGGEGAEVEPEKPPVDVEPEQPDQPTEPEIPEEPEIEPLSDADFKIAYFDFDKHNLRPDAREALEYNARMLRENPNVRVLLEGHCDERGTVEYNLALGEKRARSAREYCESLGVAGHRMEIISYGKERPVALGHNEDAWQKNRRVKFTIVEQ